MKILEKLHQLLPKKWRSKKGHFVIYVGEEQKRYVVSLKYLSSITFQDLLNQFEDEIHFGEDGKLILPCSPRVFEDVLNFAKFH